MICFGGIDRRINDSHGYSHEQKNVRRPTKYCVRELLSMLYQLSYDASLTGVDGNRTRSLRIFMYSNTAAAG